MASIDAIPLIRKVVGVVDDVAPAAEDGEGEVLNATSADEKAVVGLAVGGKDVGDEESQGVGEICGVRVGRRDDRVLDDEVERHEAVASVAGGENGRVVARSSEGLVVPSVGVSIRNGVERLGLSGGMYGDEHPQGVGDALAERTLVEGCEAVCSGVFVSVEDGRTLTRGTVAKIPKGGSG